MTMWLDLLSVGMFLEVVLDYWLVLLWLDSTLG